GPRAERHKIRDFWQWLGMSGDALGTSGTLRRTFFYALGAAVVMVMVVNTVNVITVEHEEPSVGLAAAVVWEGTSALTLNLSSGIRGSGIGSPRPFSAPA